MDAVHAQGSIVHRHAATFQRRTAADQNREAVALLAFLDNWNDDAGLTFQTIGQLLGGAALRWRCLQGENNDVFGWRQRLPTQTDDALSQLRLPFRPRLFSSGELFFPLIQHAFPRQLRPRCRQLLQLRQQTAPHSDILIKIDGAAHLPRGDHLLQAVQHLAVFAGICPDALNANGHSLGGGVAVKQFSQALVPIRELGAVPSDHGDQMRPALWQSLSPLRQQAGEFGLLARVLRRNRRRCCGYVTAAEVMPHQELSVARRLICPRRYLGDSFGWCGDLHHSQIVKPEFTRTAA